MSILNRIARLSRVTVYALLALAVLLIAARIALPHVVKWYVNKKIDAMPGYAGSIGDVDMHLWRGAYSIQTIEINKTDGDVPVPFFSADVVDFSVEWRALFQGALVAKIEFDEPVINFVKGRSSGTTQVGVDKPWLSVIKELFPLNINRFEVFQGEVHYRDFSAVPKVDLSVDRIHMLATNLTNSSKLSKTLVANIDLDGRAFQSSALKIGVKLDPRPAKPTFDLNAALDPVPLTQFNEFAQAYAKFKFTKGSFSVASELAASDGTLTGYVKPLLDDIAVINLEDVKNPLKFTWQVVVGGLTRLFRNQAENRFATKIPISGTVDNPKIAFLPTLGNLLRNEFIKAYNGKLESDVTLKDAVEAKEKSK